jgi:hypothetical protein
MLAYTYLFMQSREEAIIVGTYPPLAKRSAIHHILAFPTPSF